MKTRRFRADDPERGAWQDAEEILTSIGLSEGMVFVGVGCGEGYFAVPASRRVGPRGRIFAVDINAEVVARLEERAGKNGLANLVLDVNEAENTLFCEGCADIVFFGIDLHDFLDPVQVLGNAVRMLKPSGRLADLA